jgi:hypothetical protein
MSSQQRSNGTERAAPGRAASRAVRAVFAGLVMLGSSVASRRADAALTAYEVHGEKIVSDSTLNVTWADVASPTDLTWSAAGNPGSAQAWVAALNARGFGGFHDWALPSGDGGFTTGGGSGGYGNGASTSGTRNQLGFLWINELGNTPGQMPGNLGPFTSLRKLYEYWSSSTYAGAASSSWAFDTPKGLLINHNQSRRFAVLAVRSGSFQPP